MPNEFTVTSKDVLAMEDQMLQFTGILSEGASVMSHLGQIVAIQTPEPGGQIEKVQQFINKQVPVGKQLMVRATISLQLVNS